ncbi:hypothetical protein ACN2MM_01085 [Alkalilimnicola ehrlichii MLHE-1]|uniref:Uncharacterized protein n=1 Tax=Alkalilimnicola ehrlichii (strain ATCC BAA-1101 / DSM 17681 / MLHE-1) TaxID=187272 RepID=Q0ACF9_ALKEH|nr:hypothetical protein [Alkalilimnicola ehrlichii]ABI55478.1 hypothetical protein Mlg_0123 [Alkalilimnicola ehrlichii MLHE-1]
MIYHFIANPEIVDFFRDTAGHEAGACIDSEHQRFTNSAWAWIAQTAVLLRDAGLPVSMGPELRPDAVNLGLAADLRRLPRTADCFRVSIDADQLRARWSNAFIVQNKAQAGRRAYWVPHWPQPGLLKRDPDRQGFKNVVFFGLARNLEHEEAWWREVCGQFGMQFSVRPPAQWHDYRDVDVAIGVRRFGRKKFNNKPPTKLFNAWIAGCVFIGGADSAYYQVGSAGKDYLIAANERAFTYHLKALSQSPQLGDQMILEGGRKVNRLGLRERTCHHWMELLTREIGPEFERWSETSEPFRHLQLRAGLVMDGGVRFRNRCWRRAKDFCNRAAFWS